MADQAQDILDLVRSTLPQLNRGRWTDISFPAQRYPAVRNLMSTKNIAFDSGTHIEWRVQVRTSGAARNVGLNDEDNVNTGDVLEVQNAPYRNTTTNYAIDLRERQMNGGVSEIVDLIMVRRHDAMVDRAKLVEADYWSKPTDSTDNVTPWGIQTWVTFGSGVQGFNGGNPSGFADSAGLDRDTFTALKNYTDTYAAVSPADFVTKARRAAEFTDFESPDPHPDTSTGNDMGFYTTYFVRAALETIAESRNDALGRDVAVFDGRVLLRGIPVTRVPELENKPGNPLYGLQWGSFKTTFLRGWEMRTSLVSPAPLHHNKIHFHVDTMWNLVNYNPRLNFVLATTDPAA